MVPEVADPHVLVHVGVVEVLTQPADVTPVEIPLAFAAVRGHRSDLRTEDFWGPTAHEWVEGECWPQGLASLRHQQTQPPCAQNV